MVASHRRCRPGFTLIELLVVIAIIAILAGILFPVFARAKAKAQQTRCLANLKNIATAFQIYSADHDEMLPNVPNGTYGWDHSSSKKIFMSKLVSKLQPYTKSPDIWYCHMDVWGTRPADFKDDVGDITGMVSYSYCVQWKTTCDEDEGEWVGDPIGPAFWEPGDDFIGLRPSKQCLMMDNGLPRNASSNLGDYETPHGEMSNIAFWDGHAKALQKVAFSDIHPPLVKATGTSCP